MLNNGAKFPSPVTSSSSYNDHAPTTGDVHLYADPKTYETRTPLLYADCEGLDGGEAVPRALGWQGKDETTKAPKMVNGVRDILQGKGSSLSSNVASNVETSTQEPAKKSSHASQRDIAWAVTPETKKREYAAMKLYPRLLYTFSDVVVFVLRNRRCVNSFPCIRHLMLTHN